MDPDAVLDVVREAARRVRTALDELADWGPAGTRPGQYHSDLVADAAALEVLQGAGWSVLSEESGSTASPREADAKGLLSEAGSLVAVVDPVDGSTNASRGLPWFATSICVVDGSGPFVALVVNQATGTTYEAVRGRGARRDGRTIAPRQVDELSLAVVGLSGYPPRYFGWRQYRALGAAALDLCAVADGTLDAYADFGWGGHGVWDYLAALLVCEEAGAIVGDAGGEELVVLDHRARRAPVAAGTQGVFEQVMTARTAAFRKRKQ